MLCDESKNVLSQNNLNSNVWKLWREFSEDREYFFHLYHKYYSKTFTNQWLKRNHLTKYWCEFLMTSKSAFHYDETLSCLTAKQTYKQTAVYRVCKLWIWPLPGAVYFRLYRTSLYTSTQYACWQHRSKFKCNCLLHKSENHWQFSIFYQHYMVSLKYIFICLLVNITARRCWKLPVYGLTDNSHKNTASFQHDFTLSDESF